MSPTDTYLTVAEVAHICHATDATVTRWIRQGKLRASKVGRWLVAQSDLTDFIERQATLRK